MRRGGTTMLKTLPTLHQLYLEDETAWLDASVELIDSGDLSALDYANLREFLSDMAISERRQVKSRLTELVAHILKWVHQPEKRTRSWMSSILVQRRDLHDLAKRGVLRN